MNTLDRIKGSLLGGAAGDALGYPVEFVQDYAIRDFYGPEGITAYRNGRGWISDDTQMTLFTAAGIIAAVNHSGDSDSTGAITGNLLGAWTGFHAIDSRWTEHLELADTLLHTAEALAAAR